MPPHLVHARPQNFGEFMNVMLNRYLKLSRRSRATGECSTQHRLSRTQNSPTSTKDDNSECNMSMDSSLSSDSCLADANCNGSLITHSGAPDGVTGSVGEAEAQRGQDRDAEYYLRTLVMENDPVGQMIQRFQQKNGRYERDDILEKLVHLRMECADAYGSQDTEPDDSWSSQADKSSQLTNNSDGRNRHGTPVTNREMLARIDYNHCGIEIMLNRLHRDGMDAQVLWLQKQLLEYTHVKLVHQYKRSSMPPLGEPISLYSFLLDRDMLIVDFTWQQSAAVQHADFQKLAALLGLHVSLHPQYIQITVPRELSMRQLVENASKLSACSTGL
ncbi:hypothetical protein BIW11_09824 [Tropilaelaps mercedesae]|uniref:Uncharacterized protein n=1 Tax=Tropilaelaps mercedesae TaxID=418985 RepID=A0A1V9XID3_9ACAR|nr:hypothetical protein BIW11_09824 [Tropilaelaps mercedesae]